MFTKLKKRNKMTYRQYVLSINVEDVSLDDNIDGRYHYVYRITNVKENKHYYGSRSSVVSPEDDLGIRYYSSISSKEYKWLIEDQKKNKHNYKYKILKVFNNNKEKIIYESYLHIRFNVKSSIHFYNLSNQTPTGFNTNGVVGPMHPLFGKPRDISTRTKISKTLTGKYATEDHPNYGIKKPEYALKCLGAGNPMYGKTHSAETLVMLSNSSKGENNSQAKRINIYDSEGTLMHECNGTFKSICNANNYPFSAFGKALRTSSCVYSGTSPTKIYNKDNHKFIGWSVTYVV